MESTFNILDASIADLQHALRAGWITSVELVATYLRRISVYDASGLQLSAIPLINPTVFDEAMRSDARRAAGILPIRPLEGIPYLAKDSIKVKGMTVASGSPAFETLIATEDAKCIQTLRDAGAVLLGKTNMPAMAYGGMQRGSYGRAESPYNSDYLTAAYASGSSNGSATATTANFCAFSLGSETVSSGRSPASNNSIIAYTPSRGLLPLRGVWPLYPTCDVLVPHTRTIEDMFTVLDVLAVVDEHPVGDFWNEQQLIQLPSIETIRPKLFKELADPSSLHGKRLGIPSMFIGGVNPLPDKVCLRPSIFKLWQKAKATLEACGATVIEIPSFPAVSAYEANAHTGKLVTVKNLPDGWSAVERCELVAHAWDDFLKYNGQEGLDSLAHVDPDSIFPLAPGSLKGTPDAANQCRWKEMVDYPARKYKSINHIPNLQQALNALEDARKETLENWMDENDLDAVVFPANGDIGKANADTNIDSSNHAWSNGVKYSNGNRPIRHLGIPTISVPMGVMEDTGMPVNLTIAGKGYDDVNLLRYGYAFEQAMQGRTMPSLVPALESDIVQKSICRRLTPDQDCIVVNKQSKNIVDSTVHLDIEGSSTGSMQKMTCYINGNSVDAAFTGTSWTLKASYPTSARDKKWSRWSSPALTQTIIVVVVYTAAGPIGGLITM
ncbi:hypothetical protein ASPWEDRAFT_172354 [Aspergillus wentii DTO 134E9]|uniref:Amidase domain-containing protein n=1 Tax=Aspergillus wentii DTO 134E9 TaxID=1073089 RepID=A0A1L9RKU6_ASPWE|nr:uncharacterized protein ASPWEDRAFT_172354 [Aspergillus wentii DTO 134E9]OJJ35551.1 hypothetical protein ASPWEDRAFT_172354 [Aspergillus wentii DTO 134E9]